MELAVPCVMHGEMRVCENTFTKLLREAIFEPAKRMSMQLLELRNKRYGNKYKVNLEAEKAKRKMEDDRVKIGKGVLSRAQLAINQVLSGKRIDVSGVSQSIAMDDIEFIDVLNEEEEPDDLPDDLVHEEIESDIDESEEESDDEVRPTTKSKSKPKAKKPKAKKRVKSKIELAVTRRLADLGDEEVDLREYVPVLSELQTSIRLTMTGNVPDHFKVCLLIMYRYFILCIDIKCITTSAGYLCANTCSTRRRKYSSDN